jgi:hypothetical protein
MFILLMMIFHLLRHPIKNDDIENGHETAC